MLGQLFRPRATRATNLDVLINALKYQGLYYQGQPGFDYTTKAKEQPATSFEEYAARYYRANNVVFACMLVRMLVFSEASFTFQNVGDKRRFGNAALGILEQPWPNASTGELLARMVQDADLAGNSYFVARDRQLRRLTPSSVTIVKGSRTLAITDIEEMSEADLELVGYLHSYGRSGRQSEVFLPNEVSHFAPVPDPCASFRGMSWLTPVISEVQADRSMTEHKDAFFRNAATPHLSVVLDKTVGPDKFKAFVELMEAEHRGFANAWKTLYLGGGADVKVVGADPKNMDFRAMQGAGETRIAAAAGVPPVIVGLSEGLQAATYANYSQARRRFADGTMRPLWRMAAQSLSTLVDVPAGARLVPELSDVAFLREDEKDQAEINSTQAAAMRTLADGGWDPDAVVAAVQANDFGLLAGRHTGALSIQVQKPPA